MRKPSLKKAERLEGLDGLQPSLSDDPSEIWYMAMRYRVQRILSDTPECSLPTEYPYEIVDDGVVKLNKIFKPTFLDGKIPLLPKEKADLLLSRELGYNAKTKVASRIFRDANDTVSHIAGYPASGDAYLIYFMTAEKRNTPHQSPENIHNTGENNEF